MVTSQIVPGIGRFVIEFGFQAKPQVLVGNEELVIRGNVSQLLPAKGLDLARFHSVQQAAELLDRDNDVLLMFCETRLSDGTYEDVLAIAKALRPQVPIVIVPSRSIHLSHAIYERAKSLGAYDVLRQAYGPKDVEWMTVCALRDRNKTRPHTA